MRLNPDVAQIFYSAKVGNQAAAFFELLCFFAFFCSGALESYFKIVGYRNLIGLINKVALCLKSPTGFFCKNSLIFCKALARMLAALG